MHVQVRLSPMTCVNDTENMGGNAQVLGFSVSSVILMCQFVTRISYVFQLLSPKYVQVYSEQYESLGCAVGRWA